MVPQCHIIAFDIICSCVQVFLVFSTHVRGQFIKKNTRRFNMSTSEGQRSNHAFPVGNGGWRGEILEWSVCSSAPPFA